MSSIMDIGAEPRKGKVTKNWLKTHLFEQCRWGGPEARKSDGSIFYEMLIYGRDVDMPNEFAHLVYLGNIMYFPETFTGYAYFGSSLYGHGVTANKVVIDLTRSWFPGNKNLEIFAATSTADMNEVINSIRTLLSVEGYELIMDKKLIKQYENELA